MACIYCGRGFHEECTTECKTCHPVEPSTTLNPAVIAGESKPLGRPIKNASEILDKHSTGRKRAAQLYPLYEDKPCEWRGKDNCGGGLFPIAGCEDGLQQARHHGPVKETLENSPGNVWRICDSCHNRWHARNDDHYKEEVYAKLPHDPVEREVDETSS